MGAIEPRSEERPNPFVTEVSGDPAPATKPWSFSQPVLLKKTNRNRNVLVWSLVSSVAFAGAWSVLAPLQETVAVSGKLQPIQAVQDIEALVPGVVETVLVGDGERVERGDVLFEVAPLDSYRVILEVDERDIGQLAVDQVGSLALTGMPEDVIEIRVDKITPISTAAEGRNFFRVEASLIGEPPSLLRPGMEGVARIEVGERQLLWIWTHELVDWLRFAAWSWLP